MLLSPHSFPTRRSSDLLERQNRWALRGSFAALSVFVVMFLVPPFYMIMTSLKSSAEISAQKGTPRSEEHTSELQSPCNLVCRLLLEKKDKLMKYIACAK